MKRLFLIAALLMGVFTSREQTAESADSCTDLARAVDDFTGEISFRTPGYVSENMDVSKFLKGGKTTYYLSLYTTGATYVTDGTGVILIFSDGTKWTRKVKIDVDFATPDYRYWAFITLTPADLALFSSKQISKYRLYIFDQSVEAEAASKFTCFIKAIRSAK